MKKKWYCLLGLALLLCIPALSDTVKFKNNLSINGTIVTMADGIVMLDAEFSSGVKTTLPIAMNDVQSMDFNSLVRNPGPPSKMMGIGPGPATERETGVDVIILRGGLGRKDCKLVRIDSAQVHCDPGDSKYTRATVLRILVESK